MSQTDKQPDRHMSRYSSGTNLAENVDGPTDRLLISDATLPSDFMTIFVGFCYRIDKPIRVDRMEGSAKLNFACCLL